MTKILWVLLIVMVLGFGVACGNCEAIQEESIPVEVQRETEEEKESLEEPEEEAIEEPGEEPDVAVETETETDVETEVQVETLSNDTDEPQLEPKNEEEVDPMMYVKVGDRVLSATLVENSSTEALLELLEEGPITISMRDYANMEKVGPLGTSLPTNNEPITTEAGDIILYQGSALVIYYEPNSWNFTRIGKIDELSKAELKAVLGEGGVEVTLSLNP